MALKPKLTSLTQGLSVADQATARANLETNHFALREVQRHNGIGDLPRMRKAARDCLVGDGVHHLRVAMWGDSVGRDYIYDRAMCQLWREYGFGGLFWVGQGSNGTFITVTQSGVTYNTSDFDVTPCGFTATLGVSDSIAWVYSKNFENDLRLADMLCTKATILYVRESGAGSFDVETSDATGRTWTTAAAAVDAAAVSTSVASVTVDMDPNPQAQVRVVHDAGGNVRIVGVLLYRDDASGLILMPMTQGGINVEQVDTAAVTAAYDGLMGVLQPDVMFWSAKDDLTQLQDHLDSMVGKVENGWPYFDWCFVIPTAEVGDDFGSLDSASREYLRDYATANGHAVFDFRAIVRNYADSLRPIEPARAVTSISRSGTTATATLSNHGYESNDIVSISGAADANFNATLAKITVVNANSFTYTVANTGATSEASAQVQELAGTFQDTAHLSSQGRDEVGPWLLREVGLLGNNLASEGRSVRAASIEAYDALTFQGESVPTQYRRANDAAWRRTRGLTTDTFGVFSTGPVVTDIATGDFTISLHALATALENGWAIKLQSGSGAGNTPSINLQRSSTDQLRVTLRNEANNANADRNYNNSGIDSLLGEIAHLTLVRESGVVNLFLNGEMLTSPAADTGTPTFADSIQSERLRIYAGATSSAVTFYEAAFWSSALTPTQIRDYYRSRVAPGSPEILYRFRDNVGNFITDESGNDRHGEIPIYSSNPSPTWTWAAAIGNGAVYSDYEPSTFKLNMAHVLGASNLQEWTLPTPRAIGDWIGVIGQGSSGWAILQPAGHQIFTGAGNTVGTNATTAGATGKLASTARYDSVKLRCVKCDLVTPDIEWVVENQSGTLAWT